MAQKVYYHNITQGCFNINDLGDAVELASVGDQIMFSVRGSAIMYDLNTVSDGEDIYTEYNYIKNGYYEYFSEFHGAGI